MHAITHGGNDEFYAINVTLGTPPRPFRLTIDSTEFANVHLFHSNASVPSPCKATVVQRASFDPSASSTCELDDEGQSFYGGHPPYAPYEDPTCTKSALQFMARGFKDTMEIGGTSTPSLPALLITNFTSPLNPEWKADGWWGIWPKNEVWETYDTMDVLLRQFQRPVATFFYAR
ncbi:hypothetical protein AAVH_38014, partial [Aphelenchoides avenae]